uniref:Uncharacterized protein n=1 Tax=Arundo donax TaxID=35708 RepID=A0A0A9GDZ5_ARUDO
MPRKLAKNRYVGYCKRSSLLRINRKRISH